MKVQSCTVLCHQVEAYRLCLPDVCNTPQQLYWQSNTPKQWCFNTVLNMAQSVFNRIRQITALHCWISSSPTFLLTCNRKYNIFTFSANSIPHHHCSAILLYGHAHLLKFLLLVWLSALIMPDILEMGAFKKGEKYSVTGWVTARKGLHYIYLLGNRILKVNI